MTTEKKFKDSVRARMKRTGESYTTARRALEAEEIGAKRSAASTLPDDETHLREKLAEAVSTVNQQIRKHHRVDPEVFALLGPTGAALHALLAARGATPRHKKLLVINREAPEGSVEFYSHVHAAESLLRFMTDPNANDDPKDVTIGSEFNFDVYVRRWGYPDHIGVKRTRTGWVFSYAAGPVTTGRDGRIRGKAQTGLFDILEREFVNYPADLPGYLDWLWKCAAEEGLDQAAVQAGPSKLADWVSTCERSSPGGVFKGYS